MALSRNPFSIAKGKFGNAILYGVEDSKGKTVQGIREYSQKVANPKNPQTTVQMSQRFRLAPANNIYRALKAVIDRGFEGVKYGYPSRKKYLSLAMRNDQYPYMPKGTLLSIPAKLQVSAGSIAKINVSFTDHKLATTIALGSLTGNLTLGTVSTNILAANPLLQNGDQITVILASITAGATPALLMPCAWVVASFFIDTASDETFATVLSAQAVTAEIASGKLAFASTLGDVVAGCVIVSREFGVSGHLRSDAIIAIEDTYYQAQRTQEAFDAMENSYLSAENSRQNLDWPVEASEELPANGGSTDNGGGSNNGGDDDLPGQG